MRHREVKQFSCGHTASIRTVGLRGGLLSSAGSSWMESKEGEPAHLGGVISSRRKVGGWAIPMGDR